MDEMEYKAPDPNKKYPKYDDQAAIAIVHDFVNYEEYYRRQLAPSFSNMMRWWRLYLAQRPDHRKAHEQWRSNIFIPYAYSGVETHVAAMADIVGAADPLVQAEGIGDEDQESAAKVERLLDYTFKVNRWRAQGEAILRESAIQGTAAIKAVWREQRARVKVNPTTEQVMMFEAAIEQAVAAGLEPPEDPEIFDAWREMTMAQTGINIPEDPHGVQDVTTFRAPSLERVSLFDLRFDPLESEPRDRTRMYQRIVKPREWVLSRTGPGPDKPFDPAAVEFGLGPMPYEKWNEWQSQISTMVDVVAEDTGPKRADLVEIFECFEPNAEFPYKVFLNRRAQIAKNPYVMPYGHGEIPITLIRNVPVPGHALGISDMQQPEKLYYEMMALRDLRLDAVTLATIPVFARLSEVGIPDMMRLMRPGGQVPLPRMDSIKRLFDNIGPHPDVWRELAEIKQDIDETNSTPSQLRGGPSTVGRVSATEAERRFSQSLARMKTAVMRFEEEMASVIRQSLWLWYQYADTELILRISGQGDDPYLTISKEDLLEALDIDFNFRGASRALNQEMLTNQLMQFFQGFGAILKPQRQLQLAQTTYETMGLKNVQQIVPDSDIQEMAQQQEAQQAQAEAQAAAQAAPPAPGGGGGGISPESGGPALPPGETMQQGAEGVAAEGMPVMMPPGEAVQQ